MRRNRVGRLVQPGEAARIPLDDLRRALLGLDDGRPPPARRNHGVSRLRALRASHPRAVHTARALVAGLASLVVAAGLLNGEASAYGARTALVSSAGGVHGGNGNSGEPVVAAGAPGVVAFASSASDLTAGDTNGIDDVFVRDDTLGRLERVSAAVTDGAQGLPARQPSVSADGRYVAFVAGADADTTRIHVYDRTTGDTSALLSGPGLPGEQQPAVSSDGSHVAFAAHADHGGPLQVWIVPRAGGTPSLVSTAGGDAGAGDGDSAEPAVSADGTVVAFTTAATNLFGAGQDTNGASDVVVVAGAVGENATRTVTRASTGAGGQADGPSFSPSLGDDGTKVAFRSFATNLAGPDRNGTADVHVRDLAAGTITRASLSGTGEAADGPSWAPSLSRDGGYVAFPSSATNLVPGDTNGSSPLGRTPTNFSVFDSEGRIRNALAVAVDPADPRRVTALFAAGAVSGAVGGTVGEGAVIDEAVQPVAVRHGRSNANPAGARGSTAGPDLVAALAGSGTATFCFDGDVVPSDTSRLFLQGGDSASVLPVTGVEAGPGEGCVTGAVAGSTTGFTVGVALAGAVVAGGRANLPASVPLTSTDPPDTNAVPGFTDGPDLAAVEVATDSDAATFVFDEPVRDPQLSPPRGAPYGTPCDAPCPPVTTDDPADVFVRHLRTGRTVRASVGPAGEQLDARSDDPSINGEGRFVVYLQRPAASSTTDVFLRDLLDVVVAPAVLPFDDPEFGVARIGEAAITTGAVTVKNAGFGKLRVGAVSITGAAAGDFQLNGDGCGGNVLEPEQVCQVGVRFAPTAQGTRLAELRIASDAFGAPHVVTLQGLATTPPSQPPSTNTLPTPSSSTTSAARGTEGSRGTPSGTTTTTTRPAAATVPPVPAVAPRLSLEPSIGTQGSVALAFGTGFPPNQEVRLSWSRGLGTTVVRADASGAFRAQVLVFPNDLVGPRVLNARTAAALGTAVYLVLPRPDDATFLIRKSAERG